MRKWRAVLIPLLLPSVLAVAFVLTAAASHFELPPKENVTLDISLMLTPYGMLNFLVLTESHPLAPYYFHLTSREGFGDRPLTLLLAFIVTTCALLLLKKHFGKSHHVR